MKLRTDSAKSDLKSHAFSWFCLPLNADSKCDLKGQIQPLNYWEDNSELRPIIWDVLNMLKGFTSCRFEFVAREGNVATHAMASKAMKHLEDSFWVKEAPLKVLKLVNLDRLYIKTHLLATEGLRNGKHRDMNSGVPGYAEELVKRDCQRSVNV
ncbi:hypothetical protein Goari_003125 [Gossypium aridum]|uniref:RNase H type-1 domain-containing protein n=1 Tax=Gossypium aridum TaxID=34290 RepID=A0A7J8YAJ5_GOSAI|nr:hypothetical protein [Gossypium aridum]